jgi:atypical dual specificity phosphatase
MKNFLKNLTRTTPEAPQPAPQPSPIRPVRWIIPRQLAVGPLPMSENYPQFKESGIQSILSLCAETEGVLPPEILSDLRCRRLVLPDSHYAETMQPAQLGEAVQELKALITQNPAVYVHCLAGVERSPTVCIAYLCCEEKMPLWEALNWVKQVNPRTSPIPSQLQAVRELSGQ